jgi:hypothetical protein
MVNWWFGIVGIVTFSGGILGKTKPLEPPVSHCLKNHTVLQSLKNLSGFHILFSIPVIISHSIARKVINSLPQDGNSSHQDA